MSVTGEMGGGVRPSVEAVGADGAGPATKSRPRLRDVAALAGVSTKTASRALGGHAHVSADTSSRVIEAARLLNFRPNRLARELRLGAVSTTAGLVIGDLSNPFYSQIAAGAERVLQGQGFDLIIASTDEDSEREKRVAKAMLERRVQALLIVPASGDHWYLEAERQLGTPMVFLDRPPVHVLADSIVLDNRRAAAEAVENLLAHGHRRIGVVSDSAAVWTSRERISGVRIAMTAAGVDDWERYLRPEAHTVARARALARDLLDMHEPPTALFALNNLITAGVLEALRESAVPCALIGFDDSDLADLLRITVVAQDPVQMGGRAAELALARMQSGSTPPAQIVVHGRLIRRGSGELPPGAGVFT